MLPSTCNCAMLMLCLLLRLLGAVLLEHCSALFSADCSPPQDVMRSMHISASSKLHGQMSCLHCSCSLCVYCQCPHSLWWWLQQAEQEFRAKVEAALEANEVDEDQLIEERRRRRQEILAKHGQGQGQGQAPQPGVLLSAFPWQPLL